jgi:ATP/maltotriose-dependent transcriptional regulator MalT
MGGAMFVVETEARLAELEALRGRPAETILRAQAPLTSAREVGGLAPLEALLYRVIGMAHAQLGEPAAALEAFDTSVEIARRADAPYEAALTLHERALLTGSSEDAAEATAIFAPRARGRGRRPLAAGSSMLATRARSARHTRRTCGTSP